MVGGGPPGGRAIALHYKIKIIKIYRIRVNISLNKKLYKGDICGGL
jgi:hypothetical protein